MRNSLMPMTNKRFPKISILEAKSKIRNSLRIGKSSLKEDSRNSFDKKEENEEIRNIRDLLKVEHIDLDANFELLNTILSKTSGSRKEVELNFLDRIFHNIKFLRETKEKLNPEKVMNMYRKLTIQSLNKFDTVFSQGDYGSHFYIILKGTVGVLIPKPKKFIKLNNTFLEIDEKLPNQIKKGNKIPSLKKTESHDQMGDKHSFLTEAQKSFDNKKQDFRFSVPIFASNKTKMDQTTTEQVIEKIYPTMRIVAKLQKGDSFGELALLENCQRNATIFCLEECEFAILSKIEFKRILSINQFKLRKLL